MSLLKFTKSKQQQAEPVQAEEPQGEARREEKEILPLPVPKMRPARIYAYRNGILERTPYNFAHYEVSEPELVLEAEGHQLLPGGNAIFTAYENTDHQNFVVLLRYQDRQHLIMIGSQHAYTNFCRHYFPILSIAERLLPIAQRDRDEEEENQ